MRKGMLLPYLLSLFVFISQTAWAQFIDGQFNAFPQWGSGSLILRQPTTFESGTCLRLKIGGSVSRILIRFLRDGDNADKAVGIVGDPWNVPASRELVVRLLQRFPNVNQISVHGNPHPWHYDLGSQNGPATVDSVTIVPCPNQ